MKGQSLKEVVRSLLEKKLSENTMIVWYDQGGTLEPIIEQAVPRSVDLIRYEGSYLQIRTQIEKEGDLGKRRLIYIPREPLKPSWLRDYELFGEKIELTLPKILRDFFDLKVKPELITVLTPANCRRLASKWSEVLGEVETPMGEETLEEGLIAALLDQPSKFDVKKAVLTYLKYPEDIKERLERSSLKQVFLGLLHRGGLPPMEDLDAKRLAASLLLSEFVLNSEGIEEKGFKDLLTEQTYRKFWADAVHEWASNTTLVDSFLHWSKTVEADYGIEDKVLGVRRIENVESFQAVDASLLKEIEARVAEKGLKRILENSEFIEKVASIRERKVWSREGIIKEWGFLKKAVDLARSLEASQTEIENGKVSLMDAYFKDWWRIDQIYRELASISKEVGYTIRSAFIDPLTQRYQTWLEEINKAFAKQVMTFNKWPLPGVLAQASFWKEFVKPRQKLCIFLMDALRFELQKRLIETLKKKQHKVKHTPMLSNLPSITEVCMPSLLPSDKGTNLESVDGKLVVKIDEEIITSKADREKWLKSIYKERIAFLELDQLKEDPVSLSKKIEGAEILIVSDIKIDEGGRFIPSDLLEYLDSLVERIISAVEITALMGFPKIIVTTDHGFLFIPKPELVETVSRFSGKGLTTARRYAVGHPPTVEGCLILPLRDVGYDGEGEILLPIGISYLPRKGSKEPYIHGGLTLQECCIGVLEIEPKGLGERVGVRVELSEPITTQIFRLKLIPVTTKLFPIPRKVKVELWSKGELIGEQKAIELHRESQELWMRLRKISKTVEIRIRDADTFEIVHSKNISVTLEGYDEI